MEKYRNTSRSYNGANTDPTLRLPTRPSQKKAGLFGNDDMSAPTTFQQSIQNKPVRRSSRVYSEDDENSSDDPLDSLSETSPKKAQKDDRHKRALASQPSDFKARSDALKKMSRIPKNKANNARGEAAPTKQASVNVPQFQSKQSAIEKDMHSSPPRAPQPKLRPKLVKAAQAASSSVRRDLSSSPPPSPPSRPRPKPVKVTKAASKNFAPAPFPLKRDSSSSKPSSLHDNGDSDSMRPQSYPTLSPPKTSSVTPPSERGDCKKASKPQRFPMDVDPSGRAATKQPQTYPMAVESTSRPNSPSSGRGAKRASSSRALERAATKQPQAFPMAVESSSRPKSPSSGRGAKKALSTRVSPPFNSKNPSKAKVAKGPRNVIISESDDDSDDGHSLRAKAAPFPLHDELLKTNDRQPRKKRLSSGSSSADSSPRKRTKPGDTSLVDAYAPVEDSFFETVDPSTLCPYCDSPLPPSPSPTLRALLDAMEKKSYPDPRPTNLRGRKAPFSAFISLCQRHRFESEILPEAESKGWPSTIDWTRLAKRIEDMKPKLQPLIDDDREDGPRARSAAWNEIMQLVKEKGSRAATGIKDQFLNFEKTQPGYYGELGSMIIHQTLYDLFPPSSINVESVAPLGAEEFLQRVLIPEVALRLIMEDQHLRGVSGRKQGLQILRDSSAYGVAMFPAEQSAEPGKQGSGGKSGNASAGASGVSRNTKEGLTAGESIIMERARKRRKEIEEEEAREEEEERARMEEAERTELKPKPRPKPIARGAGKGSLMEVDVNVMPSKSDAESEWDDMRYDTDPADDLPGTGWKGKGKRVSSQASSTTSKRRSKPSSSHPSLFSDSDGNSDASSRSTRKKRVQPEPSKGRNDRSGKHGSGWTSPEVDFIDIDDEDERISTSLKTPKAKPFPMQAEDAPTPRPSRSKHGSGSQRPSDSNVPPLLRARARAEAKAKAKARSTSRPEAPVQNGGGNAWLHSMRDEKYSEGGSESDVDSARSGYSDQKKRDGGQGKAAASSLKSRNLKHTSKDADDPEVWLLSGSSSDAGTKPSKPHAPRRKR